MVFTIFFKQLIYTRLIKNYGVISMINGIKGFLVGVVVTSFILGIVFADDVLQTIQVEMNKVNLQVNGVAVYNDNLLYNGTTYVPIRKVAEMLGKEVKWDGDTNTANINDVEQSAAIRLNEHVTIEDSATKEAYDCLSKAEYFSYGPSGVAGSMSSEIKAFTKLYKSNYAKDLFVKLEVESTPDGKLYALCGLYLLDRDYYNKVIVKYKNSNEMVTVLSGCIGRSMKLSEVIKDFDQGAIPQSLKEYIDAK